jgi:ATP-binding cassette, subfamily B, bacterial
VSSLETVAWPLARAADALHALAADCGLAPRALDHATGAPQSVAHDDAALGHWIEAHGRSAGLAVEPIETTYGSIDHFLARSGPALVRLQGLGILALARGRGEKLLLVASDRTRHEMPRNELRAAMVDEIEQPHRGDVDALLDEIGVPTARRPRARAVMLEERLGAEPIGHAWLVRLADGAELGARLRRSRVLARLGALLVTHTVEYGLWIVAWALVGRAVLEGQLDPSWLFAWMLLLVTLVPLRAVGTWLGGALTVEAGGLLRRRLLGGALNLEPEEIRNQGIGQLLGRVLEVDAVDAFALGGGLATLTAGIELLVVLGVLVAAGELVLGALLVVWICLAGALGLRCLACRGAWTGERLGMTHDLVERMVGHRTRQAQETSERWHDDEDQALEQYLARSRAMDGATAVLESAAARGWLVVGLAGLAPAFVDGVSTTTLAVALGSVLLASRAIRRMAGGLSQLAGAVVAWRQIAPLFAAAARSALEGATVAHAVASAGSVRSDDVGSADGPAGWLLEAHDLEFRHAGRVEPVLRECSLQIRAGDRLLVQGPSGAGKSTLAALLVGLRVPQAGLLLLDGLDRQSLGAHAWRRRIVAAPQFHENHVLGGTFVFNALMGSDVWPPRRKDLAEVEAVCRELGLGELLDRMPAGLFQMVGETGWQLSHGERSRLYVARALLQHADLVVLDESFAALDPENLARALRCVLERARTLLVIAHP